ncbi:hypothetical protein Zmor_000984 [Zophobas morio]|uniref:Uncharacterized protein n=1 Tax=Zophobas morio TaxID=2755281 RepID=A0AA38J1S0_9CUCU|nr:hypothetical protein Zmor_000984 [Zophobas morio]
MKSVGKVSVIDEYRTPGSRSFLWFPPLCRQSNRGPQHTNPPLALIGSSSTNPTLALAAAPGPLHPEFRPPPDCLMRTRPES